MRIFSNENRESPDEPSNVDLQAHDEHPEQVQSDPVSVPQQRSGSPWSDTDAADDTPEDNTPEDNAADAEVADQERADGTEEPTGYAGTAAEVPAEHDVDGHDHGPHDAAVDLPLDSTSPSTPDEPTPSATTYGPDGTVTTTEADTDSTAEALKDDGDFDDPTAVDTETGDTAPAADKMPGSVAEPDLGTLFAAADADSFHERWRDVQLRFVDSPKEATAEAAGLLDEAVEKLAAGLRAQKETVAHEASDDTERLRVELRGYREILVRILGL
jgi:hypothetical protein